MDTVDYLEKELGKYGVTPGDVEVTGGEKINAYQTILRAVHDMGETFASTQNQKEGVKLDRYQAFTNVMGQTTVNILKPVKYKDYPGARDYNYGYPGNPGWLGQNHGNGIIDFAYAGLNGSSHYPDSMEYLNIVAHEFAHNLTDSTSQNGAWDWYTGRMYQKSRPTTSGD